MNPWQRDLIAVLGLGLIAAAAFLQAFTLGVLVVGVELIAVAFLVSLATTSQREEDDDGNG